MKSFKLNIKVIIAAVSVFSILIFSVILVIFHSAKGESIESALIDYGYIVAPSTFLWILSDKILWHTVLFQWLRKPLNIPPDVRGRWEGILENTDGSDAQKFVIEVKQTLTSLNIHSYSPVAHSVSILCEIASSDNEEKFTLCYLWQGSINTSIKDIHLKETFYGYTMIQLYDHSSPKVLEGSYFTNLKSSQTRGGITLNWVSKDLQRKFE
jgi:SMODS-associating 2TM, beta-strand rich effector domain